MAINVDIVYKTVLSILNKEQRGYLTPDEFNKIGTQVQLEIFERYVEDLNQQLRIPENESEYGNRVKNIDDALSIFKEVGTSTSTNPITGVNPFVQPSNLHRIGTVIYKDVTELQRLQRNDFLYVNKSCLTKPSLTYPIYIYEDDKIYVYPDTITNPADISVTYLRKPADVVWAYYVDDVTGGYIWDGNGVPPNPYTGPFPATGSVDFEIENHEQTNVILNILAYAGLVIRDPQIVQAAAQRVQNEEVNEKQ